MTIKEIAQSTAAALLFLAWIALMLAIAGGAA